MFVFSFCHPEDCRERGLCSHDRGVLSGSVSFKESQKHRRRMEAKRRRWDLQCSLHRSQGCPSLVEKLKQGVAELVCCSSWIWAASELLKISTWKVSCSCGGKRWRNHKLECGEGYVTELSPRFGAERELEWESPESVCTVTEKPEEESVVVKGNKKMSKVCQFYWVLLKFCTARWLRRNSDIYEEEEMEVVFMLLLKKL